MDKNKKTYEEGIQEGYDYAVQKVLEALGIEVKGPEEKAEDEEEFLNKPTGK